MTAPWYQAFAQQINDGTPTYRRCESCDAVCLPPRTTCPACAEPALVDESLSETATVVSFTEIHVTIPQFSDEAPYTVVIAEFPEGVQLTGQLRPADTGVDINHGEAVELGVEHHREQNWLLTFTPV